MTEEIEAHVLKKYEILQKLGQFTILLVNKHFKKELVFIFMIFRQGCLWYCVESY